MDFRLPALGEGIDSATVVAVKVSPGDVVADGQDVIDVETDKAAMSVAIDSAGTVGSVAVKPGDKLAVGAVILTLSGAAAGNATPQEGPQSPPSRQGRGGQSPPASSSNCRTWAKGSTPRPSWPSTSSRVMRCPTGKT